MQTCRMNCYRMSAFPGPRMPLVLELVIRRRVHHVDSIFNE